MRQCLAILLLLVFTLQVVPIRVIGKLLNSCQNTEEVQDDITDTFDGKAQRVLEGQIITQVPFDLFASRIGFDKQVSAFIHKAESLSAVHIAVKPSPPPDHC